MNFATEADVLVTVCGNSNLVCTWIDDNQFNVQLTTCVRVEIARATFTGDSAQATAALVAKAWAAANA